jgi:hypothetical protein
MAGPSALEQARAVQAEVNVLSQAFDDHKESIDKLELVQLRETVAVLTDRVQKLESARLASEDRAWKLVYMVAGGLITAIFGLIVAAVK